MPHRNTPVITRTDEKRRPRDLDWGSVLADAAAHDDSDCDDCQRPVEHCSCATPWGTGRLLEQGLAVAKADAASREPNCPACGGCPRCLGE